jgi:transcriptional regulator GlxA family with amidase domain
MDPRVEAVIALMDSSFHQELSTEDLARAVNLSSSYLAHLFKAETGVSLLQYLKSLRMRKAKELMETTFLSVKQIRSRVGARDKGHFARDFKRAYGLTPAQYKEHHRGRPSEKLNWLPNDRIG